MTYDDIRTKIDKSPFNRNRYKVTIRLTSAIDSCMSYTHIDKDGLDLSHIFDAIPKFQRDNDKWTIEMQSSFIENIIMGCKSELLFYEIGDKGYIDCMILDGLQRITAIYKFIIGDLLAFGKNINELKDEKILFRTRDGHLNLNIFTFKSEREAVEYYISINENITHSSDDIKRAKEYLKTLD